MKGLSLFSNIGVAEAYFKEIGIDIIAANELLENRANLYKQIYPETNMIIGDITDEAIYNKIRDFSLSNSVDFILATPPCQGMSLAGKKDEKDSRNFLITYAVKMFLDIKPKYGIIENVPQILNTYIYEKKEILILDYILEKLEKYYSIDYRVINTADYGVPQNRNRCIFLLTRKDQEKKLTFPLTLEKHITLEEAIGNLPSLDPFIQGYNIEETEKIFPNFELKRMKGLKVSKWHFPPTHKIRHIVCMMHTPEGKSALENEIYYPKNKDGNKVKGFNNTYKRQSWNKPANTITTYNGAICSQDNVHPGRYLGLDNDGNKIYSDARVFSIYELLILMSLPLDWNIPDKTPESLIRHTIGEGIPPLVLKKILLSLEGEKNE